MALKLGSNNITTAYFGSSAVSQMYQGSTELIGIPAPPSTADVWDFNANTYSGTGDWIDSANSFPAGLIGTPTIAGTGNSKYWEMDGSTDGFLIDAGDISSQLWSSMGSAGNAIGSLEVVINIDSINNGNFATQWGGVEANRSFIFGMNSTNLIRYYFDASVGTRSLISVTTTLPSTSTWAHVVMRWDESSNLLSTRINGTNYNGTFANTSFTWRALTTQCVSLFYRTDDCGASTNVHYLDGKAAVNRAYNAYLSDSEVDALATYWSTYY